MSKTNNMASLKGRNKNKIIFYAVFISIPIIHFLIFYVYINLNSFLMAFRDYSIDDNGIIVHTFAGFSNFIEAWKTVFVEGYTKVLNSLVFFGMNILICTPLAVLFAFYIFKKGFLSGFFKVILFIPHILSAVIIGTLYRYICGPVFQKIMEKIGGDTTITSLLVNTDTQLVATMILNLIMSFGTNVLIYESAMSGINPSIIESCQLDGANVFKEFVYIVFPMIFQTFITLLVVSFSYVFTDQSQLYTLFQGKLNFSNVGYYIYVEAQNSGLVNVADGYLNYQTLSALGLILTAIVLPTTLFVRWALNKFGPSDN